MTKHYQDNILIELLINFQLKGTSHAVDEIRYHGYFLTLKEVHTYKEVHIYYDVDHPLISSYPTIPRGHTDLSIIHPKP